MTSLCEESVNKLFSSCNAYMRTQAAELDHEAAQIRSGLRAKKRSITINNRPSISSRRNQPQNRKPDRSPPPPGEHRSASIAPPRPAMIPSPVVPGHDYATLWKLHERAWEKFTLRPPEHLRFIDVPWPPCDSDVLEFTEKQCLLRNRSDDAFLDRESKDRASYRAACRRWHPDKFVQVYGRSIRDPKESEQIMNKLTMIMQAVNESWKNKTMRSQIRKACAEEAARACRGGSCRRARSGS
ncbi:hypothetical protein FOL47_008342 [Perkinsus chesapeaki]|uniref:NF-kappa-B inhibitor-like protein 1 n=1 Tax=Perkinsus chesapeaki TaxID=330153 RepID=A0A7J6MVW4_PERCH|nr:hypothetical protein FOL47_008342 [Perkinsus chesapeaki]